MLKKVTAVAVLVLGLLAMTSAVPAQDLNTQLLKFLIDWNAGIFGVNQTMLTMTATRNGIATTATDGVVLTNTTPATVGVTSQYSPRLRVRANAFNSVSMLNETYDQALYVVPNTVAGTTTSNLSQFRNANGGASQRTFSLASSGTVILEISGVNSSVSWNNRSRFRSLTNGIFGLLDPSSVIGTEWNNGTAEPTFNNGTVTTGSRNMTGQITLTGANTGGTMTFGSPNWSFAPFCTLTGSAATDIPQITSASTSQLVVAGFTANGVFTYHCIGRI